MAAVSVDQFLERLVRSQLLDGEHLKAVRTLQAKVTDARELAQELLRRDTLTAYQVNQLFQDRGDELVMGQYIVLERLGEGGMGQVFKARQRNLHRFVALKVIRRECLDNPKVIKRFQREIRVTGQLSHPNIVHAFDADEVNGQHYIAMEYIDGIDLAHLVKQAGPLLVPQACDYIRQAALGLQHAHERGMVHRDVKPANLLVTRASEQPNGSGLIARKNSGQLARPKVAPSNGALPRPGSGLLARPGIGGPWGTVKILDMGLARLNDPETGARTGTHLTQMGTIMGTPDFVAPEQATNSRTCDIRADIYSLGCTLYFLLSARPPFPDGAIFDKLMRHQKEEPPGIEKVRRNRLAAYTGKEPPFEAFYVPDEVVAVLGKMLAKNPADRFQTPGELADTLVGVLERLAHGTSETLNTQDRTIIGAQNKTPAVAPVATPPLIVLGSPVAHKPAWPKLGRLPRKGVLLATVALALLVGAVLAQVGGPRANQPDDPGWVKTEPIEQMVWNKLAARLQKKPGDLGELRQDLVRFRTQFFNTTHAQEVPGLLARLPSPFDAMERATIDKRQLFDWQPKEVVGVLGLWAPFNDIKAPDFRQLNALAISPDGRWVVSGGVNGMLRTWDVAAQVEYKMLGHTKPIFRAAFAPDGRTFATASFDGTSKLWDASSRNLLATLEKADRDTPPGRLRNMSSVAYNPQGTLLATGGFEGVVRLYDAVTGAEKKAFDALMPNIMSVTFTPDGKFLFWGGENGMVRWKAVDADAVDPADTYRTSPGALKTLALSPDGRTVIVGEGREGALRLCTWDGKSLKERTVVREHQGIVHAVAFAPDSQTFVSVGDDKTVKIWNAKTAKLIESWELRWPILNVAFTPDGRHFVTANGNNTVYVFRPTPALAVASN